MTHFGEGPTVPNRWRWALGPIRDPVLARSSDASKLRARDLRSKNDLDVKEIVNLWAGKLRGSEVNAGQVLE